MDSVCKGCTLRIVGCHTICEQYLEEVKKTMNVMKGTRSNLE